jgi:hypothetical protein
VTYDTALELAWVQARRAARWMLLGVLAGLIAVDIRRHQNRERAASNSQPERQRDEHEDGGP